MKLVGRHLEHMLAPRVASGAKSVTEIYIYIYTYILAHFKVRSTNGTHSIRRLHGANDEPERILVQDILCPTVSVPIYI